MIVSLRDLLLEQIGDLYSAGLQQMKALPILREKASACDLKDAIQRYSNETVEHVARLDRVLSRMQEKARGVVSTGMHSLLVQAKALCERCIATTVMDAAIITAIQHVNHYEVASYGTACAFANELNANEIASLLHESLEEVKTLDRLLSCLATGKVNVNANATSIEASETPQALGIIFDGY